MAIKKIKVLYLVNIPSPYRVDFFNELGKHCELTVLFERNSSSDRDASWHSNKFNNFKAVFLKGLKVRGNTSLSFDVARYLKNRMYDVIVVGGYATPTGILAINILNFKKIPFILNVDGGLIRTEKRMKSKMKEYLIGSAESWLSTGEATNRYLTNYGAKEKNIFIYPFTSINNEDILDQTPSYKEKKELRSELNIQEEKMILSIGQFIPRKGFDLLLKAAARFSGNWGIYIIGGEPTEEYLELVKELKLKNVYFLPFKSKEELKKYYKMSDIFVLPTREDIWGLVINEAMSYGLPVITTDKCVAGIELIEENHTGSIVPVEEVGLLATQINYYLTNDSYRNNVSRNSLTKIADYTIEKMAEKHLDIFKEILDGRLSGNV